jgi:selenide,water dikinase
MAKASDVTISIEAGRVPLFDGVLAIVGPNRSGGLGSNQEHFAAGVTIDPGVAADLETILYDPQTSGGLLVAASVEAATRVGEAFDAAGVPAVRIGTVLPGKPNIQIVVRA